jgi:hypothetical protein
LTANENYNSEEAMAKLVRVDLEAFGDGGRVAAKVKESRGISFAISVALE